MSACKRFDTGWLCDTDCALPAHAEFLIATSPAPTANGAS